MAVTELLEVGSTAADGAEFTIADGAVGSIFLKAGSGNPIPSRARVLIKVKDSDGDFNEVGVLTAAFRGADLRTGRYRLTREATGDSVGAEGNGVALAE